MQQLSVTDEQKIFSEVVHKPSQTRAEVNKQQLKVHFGGWNSNDIPVAQGSSLSRVFFGWGPWECALLFVWRQQKTYHPAFLSLDFQHCRCFANTHDYFHSQTLLQDEFCYPLKCQSWVLKKVKSDTIYHTSKVIISVFMTQWLPQKSSARRAVLWGCMEGQWCFEQTPNVFTMSTLV